MKIEYDTFCELLSILIELNNIALLLYFLGFNPQFP